jgi:hypothetical protein
MRLFLPLVTAAVMATFAVSAFAQTDAQTAQQDSAAKANKKDPSDPSKGQDLVNPKPTDSDAMKSPPTVGHDKSTGNNLVGSDNTGRMQQGTRPDFKAIDAKNHGYVMSSEVHDPWLKQNFSKCDTDGDGKVTQAEYATCSKQ